MGRTSTPRTRVSAQYDARKVIIAPEGVSTEVGYFNGIVDYFDEYKNHISKRFEQLFDVCVIKRGETEKSAEDKAFAIGCSSPQAVVGYASRYIDEYHPELTPGLDEDSDYVFILVDTDNWTDKALSGALTLCKQKDFELIVSNPAFEIWLYLHYVDVSELSEEDKVLIRENKKAPKEPESYLKTELKKHVAGFSYTNVKPEDFLPRTASAISNAKKLDTPATGWNGGPFTQMPKVIEQLPEIVSE